MALQAPATARSRLEARRNRRGNTIGDRIVAIIIRIVITLGIIVGVEAQCGIGIDIVRGSQGSGSRSVWPSTPRVGSPYWQLDHPAETALAGRGWRDWKRSIEAPLACGQARAKGDLCPVFGTGEVCGDGTGSYEDGHSRSWDDTNVASGEAEDKGGRSAWSRVTRHVGPLLQLHHPTDATPRGCGWWDWRRSVVATYVEHDTRAMGRLESLPIADTDYHRRRGMGIGIEGLEGYVFAKELVCKFVGHCKGIGGEGGGGIARPASDNYAAPTVGLSSIWGIIGRLQSWALLLALPRALGITEDDTGSVTLVKLLQPARRVGRARRTIARGGSGGGLRRLSIMAVYFQGVRHLGSDVVLGEVSSRGRSGSVRRWPPIIGIVALLEEDSADTSGIGRGAGGAATGGGRTTGRPPTAPTRDLAAAGAVASVVILIAIILTTTPTATTRTASMT